MWRALLVVAGLVGALGCAPSPARVHAVEAVEAEARVLNAALDEVEARLWVAHSRVLLWEELADRHQRVSSVSCAQQFEHAWQMRRAQEGAPAPGWALARTGTRAMSAP